MRKPDRTQQTQEIDAVIEQIADLQARVKQLETDRDRQAIKIDNLVEFVAGIKMLMYLSIGGGGLSIITLILTITGINK